MKIVAISNRGARKDFYDIYFILRQYHLQNLLEKFKQKYPVTNLIHAIRSLCYFEDADRDVEPMMLEKVTWAQVKKRLLLKVQNLDLEALR